MTKEAGMGDQTKAVDSVGFVLTKGDGTVEEIKPQNRVDKKEALAQLLSILNLLRQRTGEQ